MEIHISRNALAQLGTVSVLHAIIEDELSELIIELLGVQRTVGLIVTAELSFRQRIGVLSSLVNEALPKNHAGHKRLHNALALAVAVEAERNSAVHSIWITPEEPTTPDTLIRLKRTAKAKRGLVQDFKEVTIEDIEALCQRQHKVFSALFAIRQAIQATRPSPLTSPST